jgi:starch phosphorylase
MKIPCLGVADIELPREVTALYDLAYNLWWSWSPRARRLFNTIDPAAWSEYRNPVQMLINVDREKWESLLQSDPFMGSYHSLIREFQNYMNPDGSTWFERTHPEYDQGPIVYFSSEYGLHECFNIYSGGLGVLSGDHCKSASDLGLPFVAVGLLYRHGYFRQAVDADGRQQHIYPSYDFTRLPVRPAAGPTGRPVLIEVDLPGREVFAKIWVAQVGRIPLVLLDTDIAQNDPADRPVTGLLYVRGREMRLAQEIVLGVGGVRALRALGIDPRVWHLNEGHSAFLQFERLREMLDAAGGRLEPAIFSRLRASSVFTTHTPVPAGNEQFDEVLIRKYFQDWTAGLGMSMQELLALGRGEPGDGTQPFNLTALAIRSCGHTNGVSQLHAEVSWRMWRHLFPEAVQGERAILGITNGIHTATWLGLEMLELFNRRLGLQWREMLLSGEGWQQIHDVPASELWQTHQTQKERLARFVRLRMRDQYARHGRSPDELREVSDQFDVNCLTLGFARRFATYKRAALLFSDMHRLRSLVGDPERPVQLVIAGKAHPADHPGQELIQHIYQLSQSGALRGRIFFLEDYDMRVGRILVQGVDVWLNTPRRPMEASGTSGQKAAANGCLNLSVLDGWWPEGFDGHNGWSVGTGSRYDDHEAHDREDALSLYETLEQQVIPTYYERDEGGLPQRWIEMMKSSIASITPRFSSSRMVREYVERSYLPAARPSAADLVDPSARGSG